MQSATLPPDLPPRRRPTPSQVLLGVFIVWQLFFLAMFNLLQFRCHAKPLDNPNSSAARAVDEVEAFSLAALGHWGQLTGQAQGWWMFSISLPDSPFPLVELRWGDRVETLHSALEPADPANYFHPFGASDRLLHYEMNLMLYNPWKEGKLKPEDARKKARPAYAYLRWRLEQYQHEHPDMLRPNAVILFRRGYPTPPNRVPFGPRPSPVDRPLFRWRPDGKEEAGFLPVEPYDPVARCFVPLKDIP